MENVENYSLKDVADITFFYICPCCKGKIEEDELWTEEDNTRYHFSCYNMKKAKEQEQE
jgi:hypothetical protein